MNIVKGNEEYCKTLGLFGESLQIKDPLFDMIEGVVRQLMDFENLMLMTFDMKYGAARNFLNLLKFHQ